MFEQIYDALITKALPNLGLDEIVRISGHDFKIIDVYDFDYRIAWFNQKRFRYTLHCKDINRVLYIDERNPSNLLANKSYDVYLDRVYDAFKLAEVLDVQWQDVEYQEAFNGFFDFHCYSFEGTVTFNTNIDSLYKLTEAYNVLDNKELVKYELSYDQLTDRLYEHTK